MQTSRNAAETKLIMSSLVLIGFCLFMVIMGISILWAVVICLFPAGIAIFEFWERTGQ